MPGINQVIREIQKLPRFRCNRSGNWELTNAVFPGGYPLVVILDDGAMLCTDCANEEEQFGLHKESGFKVEAVEVYWEGPTHWCCHCGAKIESAYGDPS